MIHNTLFPLLIGFGEYFQWPSGPKTHFKIFLAENIISVRRRNLVLEKEVYIPANCLGMLK